MIGIIQFRTDASLQHERECFDKYLPYQDLEFLSVFKDKDKVRDSKQLMDRYDKIILAGSSELLLSRDDPLTHEARMTILPTAKRLIEANFPTLGICFGHQLLSLAMGGVVANADSQAEGGVQRVKVTDAGWNDPLFEDLRHPILVSEGHNDSVVTMPKDAKHLAFSDRCPAQAMKVGDNIYGVQFHPELVKEDLVERWRVSISYENELMADSGDLNHGPTILNNFVSLPLAV